MHSASRTRAGILSLAVALAGLALPACNAKKDATKETGKVELEQAKTLAKQSWGDFKTRVARLQQDLSGVRARFEALPEDMPGHSEFRSKLFAVEEVLGVENGRVKWLSEKLDAASASGSKEQLKEISDLIRDTMKGNLGMVVVELDHQVMRFERMVFRRRLPLPTNYEIKAARDGLEQRLVDFIEDGTKKVDKTTWFTFDRLSFLIGDAKPDLNESKSQLENVVAILKSYPQVKLAIGIFTDKAAPPAASKKLSAARAKAIKDALITLGAEASRLRAEDYGTRYPVCPANDTPDCQASNRRVAAQVTAK